MPHILFPVRNVIIVIHPEEIFGVVGVVEVDGVVPISIHSDLHFNYGHITRCRTATAYRHDQIATRHAVVYGCHRHHIGVTTRIRRSCIDNIGPSTHRNHIRRHTYRGNFYHGDSQTGRLSIVIRNTGTTSIYSVRVVNHCHNFGARRIPREIKRIGVT